MAKIDIFCKIKKRNIKVDERLAKVLVKANRAEYISKPVHSYQNKMMKAEEVSTPIIIKEDDEREALRSALDDAGIPYDRRWGLSRLQELVDAIGKDE